METDQAIILREFSSCLVALSSEDYALVRARYAGKIDVAPTERAGVYRLSARDHVGCIALPGGRLLFIQPKVDVANLFYMMCADASAVDIYSQRVGLQRRAEIFPFVLSAIVREVEILVARGLYHDYKQRQEDLPLVRGKIALGAQISRYGSLKHRHICSYAESTHDTAENRIVATTLRQAVPLLRLADDANAFGRARALLGHFERVTMTTRSEALGLLAWVKAHRLNRAYWPLLALCGLVLNGLSLHEEAGPYAFSSFLVDMPRLFESFLTVRLSTALKGYGLRAVAQRHDYLDVGRQVGIRPDILVYSASGTKPLLVIDAKYRQLGGEQGDLNRDLYQVSAYMDRYKLSRGMLVYPQWERPGPAEVALVGTPKEMYISNLDLSAPTPAALDEECSKLAGQIAALSVTS